MLWNRIKNVSIRWKLTLLVQAAVLVALTLTCVTFSVNHRYFVRDAVVKQLTSLTDVLGSNCSAALVFDDDESARQVLASLGMQPNIEFAAVYDASGSLFATYAADEVSEAVPTAPDTHGHAFTESGFLEIAQDIVEDEEVVGRIFVQANLDVLRNQLTHYAGTAMVIFVVAFGASNLLAHTLQKHISTPILALAQTAERISAEEDYSIRVKKPSGDEIGVLYDQFNQMLDQVEASENELQRAHDELEQRVEDRTRQLSVTNTELSKEVTERRRAEEELARAHRDLVEAARSAGMAEVASGVLHNVGNVLNSVNVSATTISDQLRESKQRQLDRVIELLEQHRGDLGEFLTADEKGRHVPDLLSRLATSMRSENSTLQSEATLLASNIEHIKAIIATQQSYAGVSGVVEPLNVNDLLEDALKLNASSFERHHIRIERKFADLPPQLVDKQRFLQIVINLVKNAKEALEEQDEKNRVLTLRTAEEENRLVVQVSDTGVGIEEDSLNRIFSHGYTTKVEGHGFGLHSCANAASEMHGELRVHSEGRMRGATFTLSLPIKQPTMQAS